MPTTHGHCARHWSCNRKHTALASVLVGFGIWCYSHSQTNILPPTVISAGKKTYRTLGEHVTT